jgi:hypothetical protein
MVVLSQMHLQTMAVLALVITVHALELVGVRVRLHVRVQHGLVHTRIRALGAFEWFGTIVIA